jgi:release factor glutamine methyltransferase
MQAAIAYIRKELKGHYPPNETEALIRFLFSVWKHYSTTDLLKKKDDVLTTDDRLYIQKVIARLKKQEPIQYILGETEFFGLSFHVTPDVLIPRPETEELVEWILSTTILPDPVILDVGTGSGCIAISLKKHLPGATVTACDISEKALHLARENAARNQTAIDFIQLDLLKPVASRLFSPLDLIVSNPPYVTEKGKNRMQENVVNFEPHSALFVPDNDPLKFYRALIAFGKQHLKDGGWQFWEINESYGDECIALLREHNFINIELRKDINGKDRMVAAEFQS